MNALQIVDILKLGDEKVSASAPLKVDLKGWIRTSRHSKNVSFVELVDGSSNQGLQLVIDPKIAGFEELKPKLHTGASIRAVGDLLPSPAKGQRFEVRVSTINVMGEADPETYPLQKKGHSLEFLREILHLRPRTSTFGAVFRVRSKAAYAIHKFFQDNGFFYLTAPIITTADCEGAGEMFRVTTLNEKNPPKKDDGTIDYDQDFFKARASLTVSGQLEGEIFATALSKIYTFGPTFRAENSNTTRHLAEFWMIEPEMAFFELQDNINLARDFIVYVIDYLLNNCGEDLQFLQEREWGNPKNLELLRNLVGAKFEVLEYTEAIAILERAAKTVNFEFPVRWGIDLQAEHERYLTEQHVKGPLFVINYPREIKAFYMRLNDDGKTVRAMDLLAPGIGEIIGGSQREERHDQLLQKIREFKLPEEEYSWYLELRKFGTVPHSGFGLGFERLLMYVTGMQNIRDVAPFPRFPGFARF